MSRVDLKELDASDLLDVLHFYFEEDTVFSSEEQLSSRSKIREAVYGNMYGTEYKYKYVPQKTSSSAGPASNSYQPSATQDFDHLTDGEEISPFDPKTTPRKPPLDESSVMWADNSASKPFGDLLDAPMGA